jgi:hypothetical protein
MCLDAQKFIKVQILGEGEDYGEITVIPKETSEQAYPHPPLRNSFELTLYRSQNQF